MDVSLRTSWDVDLIWTSNRGRRLELSFSWYGYCSVDAAIIQPACGGLQGIARSCGDGVHISVTKIFFLGTEAHYLQLKLIDCGVPFNWLGLYAVVTQLQIPRRCG